MEAQAETEHGIMVPVHGGAPADVSEFEGVYHARANGSLPIPYTVNELP